MTPMLLSEFGITPKQFVEDLSWNEQRAIGLHLEERAREHLRQERRSM